jgi:cell division protein FtsA
MVSTMPKSEIVTGLDIGTTKVCAIIGEKNNDGEVEVIGVGETESEGLRQGVVTNVENTVGSISEALEEAQLMAGVETRGVYVGLAGGHIQSLNSKGVIAVSNGSREITPRDVERVIDAATAVSIPPGRELINIITQEYYVDGQDGINDPVGMTGVRLEAEVHAVTAAVASAQNIVKSVHKAGYDVEDIVLEPLASSYAVLDEDEKELGVCLVDIGGGTSDLAIFSNGSIYDTEVISIGGEHVSQDVMKGLCTSSEDSEAVKINHGCAKASMVSEDEIIEVPSVGGREPRELPRRRLCEIIEPRMEEIFRFIDNEIKQSGYRSEVIAGMVCTGGASGMKGTVGLGEKILDMPVRMGEPWGVSGLIDVVNNPKYATGVGLVQYGFERSEDDATGSFSAGENLFQQITNRMKEWFSDVGSILSPSI